MRTLIWMTGRGGELAGGHRVQMEKTAEALRVLGVDAETAICDELPSLDADLVHGFGLSVEQIAAAKARGMPVALSTIYWPRRYYRRAARARSRARYLQSLARNLPSRTAAALRVRSSWDSASRAAFAAADLLLPNSRGEAAAIRHDLGVATPTRIVPNGFDASVFVPPAAPRARDRVVYVGRLEPHKNQLRLIEALRDTDLPLSLVGSTHPHHEDYAVRCRAAAAGQAVEFWPQASQAELAAVYGAARVHAMPSFFETTGLASLEAAACGCAVVSTGEGWASEYFGDHASYCQPASRRSIRAAVLRAWAGAAQPALREHVAARFTWEHAARATQEAYEWLLA